MSDEKLVEATIARDFTSTIYGNLSAGQKVEMSIDRYNDWLGKGMVEELVSKKKASRKAK